MDSVDELEQRIILGVQESVARKILQTIKRQKKSLGRDGLKDMDMDRLAKTVNLSSTKFRGIWGFDGLSGKKEVISWAIPKAKEIARKESREDVAHCLQRVRTQHASGVEISELLQTPIEDLELMYSTRKSLEAAGVMTLGDLVSRRSLKESDFHLSAIEESKEILDKFGLELGMNVDPYIKKVKVK